MKAISVILVVCAALFFAGGGIATWQGLFDVQTYALVGGILGSLASVIGLLAFASPRLTDDDVLSVESQLVQRLADATTSLNEYESRISENKEELEKLKRDRLEIELLVRQASTKVFLEEKLKRLSSEIEDRVLSDSVLADWLQEYEQSKQSVIKIDGEIAASGRADLISEIVGEIGPSRKRLYVEVGGIKVDVSPFLRASEQLVAGIIGTRIIR